MGKCVFNQKWCTTYPWVTKAEDKFKAYCKVCRKIIDLSKMGEGALRSHEKAEKHRFNTRLDSDLRGLESFFFFCLPYLLRRLRLVLRRLVTHRVQLQVMLLQVDKSKCACILLKTMC